MPDPAPFRNPRSFASVLTLTFLVVAAPEAAAQTTFTWAVSGPGDFATPANWTPTGVPGSGDIAVLNRDSALPTIAASRTNLRFQAEVGSGMGLTVQGGTAYTLTDTATTSFAIGNMLLGPPTPPALPPTFALRSAGAGMATLNTVNAAVNTSASGGLSVGAGAGGGSFLWNNTGNLTVGLQRPGVLTVGAGGRVVVGGTANLNVAAAGTGDSAVSGPGATLTASNLSVITFATLSINNGGTLTAGTASVTTLMSAGGQPRVNVGSGGTWTVNGGLQIGVGSANGAVEVTGGSLTAQSVSLGAGGASLSISGGGQVDAGAMLLMRGTSRLTVSGTNSRLVGDTLALSPFEGTTVTVSDGGTVTARTRLSKLAHDLTIGSGGTVVAPLGNVNEVNTTMAGTLRVTAGTGTLELLRGRVTQTGSALYQAEAGAMLRVVSNPFTLNAGTTGTFDGVGSFAFVDVAGDPPFSHISGAGAVVKSGTGTMTLAVHSTYTGGTVVNGGRLLANNAGLTSATGSGPVTVNSGGTLGGTGRVAGMVSVNGGAILAPGASPGILTVAGPVSLAGGATFAVELNGPTPGSAANNHDQLSLAGGGSITLGNATLATSLGYAPSPTDALAIILGGSVTQRFAGLPDNARFAVGNFGGTTYHGNISYQPTAVVIFNITPVPEPGTFALVGFAVAAGYWRLRRRAE